MATYAIGDLHGAFDEFHRLLELIRFRYDGSDTLYLLGDYGDWGRHSMETILFVKDLDERYPFVHCLMGNHERMFLETIESGYDNVTLNETAQNWTVRNHGGGTWAAFMQMTTEEQKSLVLWMQSLPYSADAVVGSRRYLLAHAYPYFYDENYEGHMKSAHEQAAVWRRLMIRENPFANYHGDKQYYKLICGHTITNVYYRELRGEKDWRGERPIEGMRNKIFYGERFIDIDCGAKCLDLDPEESEIYKVAVLRAQLAALRLEDEHEFYVHRTIVEVPDIQKSIDSISDSFNESMDALSDSLADRMDSLSDSLVDSVDSLTESLGAVAPEIKMPEIKMPEVKVPHMRLSEYGVPIFKSLDEERKWNMTPYEQWFRSIMSGVEQEDQNTASEESDDE